MPDVFSILRDGFLYTQKLPNKEAINEMASSTVSFLDEVGESTFNLLHCSCICLPDIDQLHAVRLLAVEQRPFQRVYKRLAQPESLIFKRPKQQPTPPLDVTEDDAAKRAAVLEREAEERRKFREDMLLDFAALESTMVRIQLLQRSNERERERYSAEKLKILETAEAIKNNTTELRHQLEQARQMME